jgi:hypothetical protein
MGKPQFPIHRLSERHPGLTKALGESYTEAARVCFDRHHNSPIEITISGPVSEISAILEWDLSDKTMLGAYANEIDATEAAAYACALAAVELALGLVGVHRAETKTGADYYIAPVGETDDLENAIRLEISGMDRGDDAALKRRLKMKVDQAKNGQSNLPALASVVSFQSRKILIQAVE